MRDPAVLVMAKAPVAGDTKTRLAAEVGNVVAADVAAAALLDTLDACESAFPPHARVIALAGNLRNAARRAELSARLEGWHVIGQRGSCFGGRLARAHAETFRLVAGPVVQIGADTPQVSPDDLLLLSAALRKHGRRAALGPATDGGWWALGVTDPRLAEGLVDVPMSTSETGQRTLDMLSGSGASVSTCRQLTDVDRSSDAHAVTTMAPHTRFAHAWQHWRSAVSEGGLSRCAVVAPGPLR